MKKLLINLITLFPTLVIASTSQDFLIKPTGKYNVAVEQYNLTNSNICPDYFYESKDNWFYQNDASHCHKLNLYLYYPTMNKSKNYLGYYNNDIQQIKLDIKNRVIESNNVINADEYINQELKLKSYVLASGLIVNQRFPLVVFSPGMSLNSYWYQNFITNLVSHGYIVAAIDSAYNQSIYDKDKSDFLNSANTTLESGISSIWKSRSNIDVADHDVNYVIKILQNNTIKTPISNHINFNNVGGLGHSLGGRSIYNLSQESNTPFKAAVAMEIGRDKTLLRNNSVGIPFVFINAANMAVSDKEYFGDYSTFNLGKNNFRIQITPNENNVTYSSHLSFTDYSTLRYNDNLNRLYNLTYNQKFSESDYNRWYGSANGFNFTNDVNNYLVSFFDFYLKRKRSSIFTECKSINANSMLYCGKSPIK